MKPGTEARLDELERAVATLENTVEKMTAQLASATASLDEVTKLGQLVKDKMLGRTKVGNGFFDGV